MASFNKWLDTFIDEKGIDRDTPIEVEGPSGTNYMTVQNVLDMMKIAPANEQSAIKTNIIRLDFRNANVLDYIKHLAKAIAQ